MPGFIGHTLGGELPIIDCDLSLPIGQWSGPGDPPLAPVHALIDTGATNVVVNSGFVAQLGLPAVGTIQHTVVGGAQMACQTHASVVVFRGTRAMLPAAPYTYSVTDVLAIDETLVDYDVIIGWDVLRFVDLNFRRDGSISLHFP
ncbi:aspartyl protease family protein [Erythrobacter sp. AP23]|uniref:retroviral-like aspartic protease family protein n=1 Tax=Erythrobacter sp. AP23 TaxID=499656 RepID=UPI00076CADCE|nr:aspartyl protease family protein [Erythrobacter sp. AP23]KWV92443.1 hypothetical protein ASS64_14420 [Erythrobacter sp. AP23]